MAQISNIAPPTSYADMVTKSNVDMYMQGLKIHESNKPPHEPTDGDVYFEAELQEGFVYNDKKWSQFSEDPSKINLVNTLMDRFKVIIESCTDSKEILYVLNNIEAIKDKLKREAAKKL